MYFWNVKQLTEDLKHNKITEAGFKNYYIAGSIIMLLTFLFLTIAPRTTTLMVLATFIIQLGLLISWMNAIFKANGGEAGQDILKRIIALYLPVTVQTLVIFVGIGIVFEFIFQIFLSSFEEHISVRMNNIKDLAFEFLIGMYFYWRIYQAIKAINQSN